MSQNFTIRNRKRQTAKCLVIYFVNRWFDVSYWHLVLFLLSEINTRSYQLNKHALAWPWSWTWNLRPCSSVRMLDMFDVCCVHQLKFNFGILFTQKLTCVSPSHCQLFQVTVTHSQRLATNQITKTINEYASTQSSGYTAYQGRAGQDYQILHAILWYVSKALMNDAISNWQIQVCAFEYKSSCFPSSQSHFSGINQERSDKQFPLFI